MPLTYECSKVSGWKDFTEADRVRLEGLVFLSMGIGLPGIDADPKSKCSVERFLARAQAFEKLHGCMLRRAVDDGKGGTKGEDMPTTLEDVRRFVGLRTNVSYLTPTEFGRKLVRNLKESW